MTPPNRIYIRPYSRVATEVHWRVLPYDNGDGTCVRYIKYDALLEKLEKVAAEYKKRSDKGELVWRNIYSINEAIDILNKM